MIIVKSDHDIALIKKACAIWKLTKQKITETIKPGMTTKELDLIAKETIENNDAKCAFHQYHGFPGYICISVNDQLIHGIGDNYSIKPGDLISFDIGVEYQNHICDACFSLIVPGKDNPLAKAILDATISALDNAIKKCDIGARIGDISAEINHTAQLYGYEVIKDFSGHGCGNKLHEDPMIPCFGQANTGTKLVKNMTICIEPMLMTKTDKYYIDKKNK